MSAPSVAALVAACRAAAAQPEPQAAVVQVLRALVTDPGWPAVLAAEVAGADPRGVAVLHADDTVTVVHVALAPGFRSRVHDHGTWAVISVYAGREDNVFYRRTPEGPVVDRSASVVAPGVLCMAEDDVHHIENPLQQTLCGVHVYGADLRTAQRSSWDLATGVQTPEGGAAGR